MRYLVNKFFNIVSLDPPFEGVLSIEESLQCAVLARDFAFELIKGYDKLDENFYSIQDWSYDDILKYFEDEVYGK